MTGQNLRGIGLSTFALCLLALGSSDTAWAQTVTLTQNGSPITQPLTFNVPLGSVSTAQTIHVTTPPNNGNTVTVQIPQAYSWIQVTPGVISNTPGDLTVSVNATSLTTGSHTGNFSVMIVGNPNSAATVTVTANVNGGSVLSATPSSLSFAGQASAGWGLPKAARFKTPPPPARSPFRTAVLSSTTTSSRPPPMGINGWSSTPSAALPADPRLMLA